MCVCVYVRQVLLNEYLFYNIITFIVNALNSMVNIKITHSIKYNANFIS